MSFNAASISTERLDFNQFYAADNIVNTNYRREPKTVRDSDTAGARAHTPAIPAYFMKFTECIIS